MSIKTFAIAAAVAAGLASRADAQVIYSGGTYSTPGVVYSSYSTPNVVYSSGSTISPGVVYSSYSTPTYSYAPSYGSGMVRSGYSYPMYSTGYAGTYDVYGNRYYGNSGNRFSGSPYTAGYYGANSGFYSPYSNASYSGYNNLYSSGAYGLGVGTRGASFGGRRIGRW